MLPDVIRSIGFDKSFLL